MAMACIAERLCCSGAVASCVTLRRAVALLSVTSVAGIAFFYHRHNHHCEPFVYSLFCLSEYFAITLNMIYHLIGANMVRRFGEATTDINANAVTKC
jgi:hypothetical protein